MRQFRSPNPLIDSRRPQNNSVADLNPPGFVWHPIENAQSYELKIGPDPCLKSSDVRTYQKSGRTLWVSPEVLSNGTYYWSWRALGCGQDDTWSETFSFHITGETSELKVPPASEVIGAIGNARPRHLLPESRLETYRADCKGKLKGEWERLKARARQRLDENFMMTEPPYLPDQEKDQNEFGRVWKPAMTHSRQMGQDAQLFGLVYLIEGDEAFGRAAIDRLLEFSSWDPEGSTSTFHNNEAHMSVMNLGSRAYDWVHGLLTDEEKATIQRQFLGRGRITMERFKRADYGVIGYDNHSGRLLGFLGEICIVLAGECPEIEPWLDYILDTTVAMFPWWGGKDGGWAQGVSYSTAYCYLFYHFVYGLREASGVDFYKKPFFQNHGHWRMMCVPPNAYLVPFGDGRTNGQGSARSSWGLQRHLGRIYNNGLLMAHANQIQEVSEEPIVESQGLFSPLSFLTPDRDFSDTDLPKSAATVFNDIGWLVYRANLIEPEKDIRFTMKSSPYGTVSHSHADQNSFVIEAYGEPLAIPSGMYELYSSAHHHGWTRQTRAHNAVTFDGAGQIVRSPEAVGSFPAFHTDDRFTYAMGDASPAYDERVASATREVLVIDNTFFVMIDRFKLTYETMWTWHLHAAKQITVDTDTRCAFLAYDKAAMDVVFCHRNDMRFRPWDGYDIMPYGYDTPECLPENAARFHLDVSSAAPVKGDALLTVLFPRLAKDDRPEISALLDGQGEGTRINSDGKTYTALLSRRNQPIDIDGCQSDASAAVVYQNRNGNVDRVILIDGNIITVNGKNPDENLITRLTS